MATATLNREANLGLPPDSYIYKIISTGARSDPLTYSTQDQLALISSDDSLRFLDPSGLKVLPDGVLKNVNKSVTCLERVDDSGNVVATAGRDGLVRFWDKRSRKKALEIQGLKNLPLSALVCSQERNLVAAGVENPEIGLGDTPVYIWDMRKTQSPHLSFVESHTDTVTDLQLHPNLPTLLLSASTDGLINIFDASKPDEDDALYQVINHQSAVHCAGFMYPGTDIYCLGTDETLSFYTLQSQEEEKEEPAPYNLGDVREKLDCEYLVKMHWIGQQPYLAAGKHSSKRLDLIPITKAPDAAPLHYGVDLERRIHFHGAHGEEIVRDICTEFNAQSIYTCGEDGLVRSWSYHSGDVMETETTEQKAEESRSKKKKKDKRKGEDEAEGSGKKRYKPY